MGPAVGPELLAGIAGGSLSLIMSYVPGLNNLYERLSPTAKQLVMAFLLLVAAFGSAAWICSTPGSAFGTCLRGADWRNYVTALIAALVTNQATHRITKPDQDIDKQRTAS